MFAPINDAFSEPLLAVSVLALSPICFLLSANDLYISGSEQACYLHTRHLGKLNSN